MPSNTLRAVLIGVLACGWASTTHAAHPNALWRVVHGLCVTDKRVSGSPAPCMAVNLAQGWAVVSDPRHATQVLLVPTARISGIESSRLLASRSPNYWQFAWEARRFFERRVGHEVPRDQIAMAVNSEQGRSQDQLHIHIDCVRESVRLALKANENEIASRWAGLSFGLVGHQYQARWLESLDVTDEDPFRLLAKREGSRPADMVRQTLAVVAMNRSDGSQGFVLLSAASGDPGNPVAVSEELLDHRCLGLSLPSNTPQLPE